MAEVEKKEAAADVADVKEEITEEDASLEEPSSDVTDSNNGGNSGEGGEQKKEIVDEATQHSRIVRQIEYYFGDVNLTKDRFLKELVQADEGWIPGERMLKFNRLRQICDEWDVIVKALRDSSQLVQVHEDGTKIRRDPSKPLPDDSKERREELAARTIYCNRFPLDTSLDELMTFFETFGPVDNVYMKRDFKLKTFKGSVFVAYKCKEDAEKFLADEGTRYNETVLEVKQWRSDYFKSKPAQKKEAAKKLAEEKAQQKETKEKDNKTDKPDKPKAEDIDAEDEEKVRQQMTKGAVLHISGMNQETEREEVRALFLKHGDVSWVDFDKGVTEGYVRLKEPNGAAATLASLNKMEGGIKLHGSIVHVRIVEGDEELQYWQKMYRDIAERKQLKKEGLLKHRAGQNRRDRDGRGWRGGRRGKRGRRHYDRDGAPPAKVSKGDYWN